MVGDDVSITEDLYVSIIGRYATTVEVLSKRIALKDQELTRLEGLLADKAQVPEDYRIKLDTNETDFVEGLTEHVKDKYGKPINEVKMEEINPYYKDKQGYQGVGDNVPTLIFQEKEDGLPDIIGMT